MVDALDIDDVRDMLRDMSRPTTDSALAKRLGVSAQYLCDVLLGRREPGPKLLAALKLRKEVRYIPIANERDSASGVQTCGGRVHCVAICEQHPHCAYKGGVHTDGGKSNG